MPAAQIHQHRPRQPLSAPGVSSASTSRRGRLGEAAGAGFGRHQVKLRARRFLGAGAAQLPSGKEHGVQSAAGDQLRLVQPSHQAAVPLRWVAERRPADGGESIDTRYHLLSAKPTAKRFGHTVRSHCAIENSLHLCQVPDSPNAK